MAWARSESIFCWPRARTDFFREEYFPEDAVWILLVFPALELVDPDLVAVDFVDADADFAPLPDFFAAALWCFVEVRAAAAGLVDVGSVAEL